MLGHQQYAQCQCDQELLRSLRAYCSRASPPQVKEGTPWGRPSSVAQPTTMCGPVALRPRITPGLPFREVLHSLQMYAHLRGEGGHGLGMRLGGCRITYMDLPNNQRPYWSSFFAIEFMIRSIMQSCSRPASDMRRTRRRRCRPWVGLRLPLPHARRCPRARRLQ